MEVQRSLLVVPERPGAANSFASSKFVERRLRNAVGNNDGGGAQTTVIGAYVVGAVGGGISMIIGLACAWLYASGQYGLTVQRRQDDQTADAPGYEFLGNARDKRSL